MLICPFHWLTGLNCPLCGAQRMAVALLHGHVGEAFWLNPALMVGVPVAAAYWLWRREVTPGAAFAGVALLLAWGVVRNILSV